MAPNRTRSGLEEPWASTSGTFISELKYVPAWKDLLTWDGGKDFAFTSADAAGVAAGVADAGALQTLWLQQNQLTALQTLWLQQNQLAALQTLWLQRNQLTALQTLWLQQNQLTALQTALQTLWPCRRCGSSRTS